MMIAGGKGCVLVLKNLLEEPVNLSNILRMLGGVFLTILEPACVNNLFTKCSALLPASLLVTLVDIPGKNPVQLSTTEC